MRFPIPFQLGEFWSNIFFSRKQEQPAVASEIKAPPPEIITALPQKTKLDIARIELAKIDKKISRLLLSFQRSSELSKTPDSALLSRVKLPEDIENLSIDMNTPRELFAGVMQFLALEEKNGSLISSVTKKDKTKEFKELCEQLCSRHKYSRLVFEYKQENADEFRGDDGKVITFIKKQHDNVVKDMGSFCTSVGSDSELGEMMIEWIANVNSGWQDMGINENTGPFIEKVTKNSQHEVRYPSLKAAA